MQGKITDFLNKNFYDKIISLFYSYDTDLVDLTNYTQSRQISDFLREGVQNEK